MDEQTQSTYTENPPAAPRRTGTVQDVRPPTLDPKDLPEDIRKIFGNLNPLRPQEGTLEDNSTGEIKRFIGNLNPPLEEKQVVYYQDLQNNPNYDAVVIGRP